MSLIRLPAALVLAACGVLGTADTASAAWNNVFQVCCDSCNKPRTSYSAPQACPTCPTQACPQACPQPQMQISYVQRCYYQPVTEYVRKSYYEAVTKNVTSYYYEPVTSYKYTTYYDPCTGCPQKVCTPCTSYALRSKCNAVTSYVERCAMVPVTTLKPVTVRQPVVSYYYPPEPSCPAPSGSAMIPPAAPEVQQIRENPPSVMPEKGDMIPPTPVPGAAGSSFPRTNPNLPKIRPDKTTSRSSVVAVRGEIVAPDQLTPKASAKLVFVNADDQSVKQYATANQFGEFDVKLAAGKWYLYLGGDNGKATYHKTVTVGDRDSVDYRVVSR
ncbi:MAG: hypothetical protein U0791_14025 [Gemmataceae bacterium]